MRAYQYRGTESKVLPKEDADDCANADDPNLQSPRLDRTQLFKRQGWRIIHLLRRLLTICAAIVYIMVSLNGVAAAYTELDYSSGNQRLGDAYFSIPLIGAYAGNSTMRQSPIVQYLLGNVTTLRSDTLYLDYVNKTVKINHAGCSAALYNEQMYGNAFLRELLAQVIAGTSYNHTFFSDLELIIPVVDCTFWPIAYGKHNLLRLTYVMRSTTDVNDVYFLAFQLSTQDYAIPAQRRAGMAAVAMFSYFNDIRQTSAPNYFAVSIGYPFNAMAFEAYEYLGVNAKYQWRLANIVNPSAYASRNELVTAIHSGFYANDEDVQANVMNTYTVPETTPRAMLANWHWVVGSIVNDSWAWVHFIHVYFACDAIFNLLILLSLIVRNARAGNEIWIGDAFASISKSLLLRSTLVFITWVMDHFWINAEYAIYDANVIWNTVLHRCQTGILQADLLTLYLGAASLMGLLLRERIDPAFVVFSFFGPFVNRDTIVRSWASVSAYLTRQAEKDFDLSTVQLDTSTSDASPMTVWTAHSLPAKDALFMLTPMLPIFISISYVLAYALLKKTYHHYFPNGEVKEPSDSLSVQELQPAQKSSYTMFEIATGAALQVHYGVISDYENCQVHKGIKYASADGIYGAGYVIAGAKFLLATEDLLAVIVMKLTRRQFTKVYVHRVENNTVERTGQLVYPETIAWSELFALHIGILS